MDTDHTVFISSQLFSIGELVLGAAAAFFAILLWPKTRDMAWMLIIFGTILLFIETVYSIFKGFGTGTDGFFVIFSIPVISLMLSVVRNAFFISAFAIMIYRQSRLK